MQQAKSTDPSEKAGMNNKADDLRKKLEVMIRRGVLVESCFVLIEMLDRAELEPRMVDAFGNQACVWSSKASDRTLDRVAGIEDVIEQALFSLFVDGEMHLVVADRGRGLDLQWQLPPEPRKHPE